MKILLTSRLDGINTLVKDIYNKLTQHTDVECSIMSFWNTPLSSTYDIIHVQWPEQLFDFQNINERDIQRLSKQLKLWKAKGSKIVVTRHNILPHDLNALYETAYEILYSFTDSIIHFSQASIDNFSEMYLDKFSNAQIKHTLIYHPMYTIVHNNSSKQEAKKYLGIQADKRVILVFGNIRHEEERKFALNTFNKLSTKNKFLLAPRWYSKKPTKKKPFKRLIFKIKAILNKQTNTHFFGHHSVPEEDIHYYMNGADIVFIPRMEVLNSGVLLLAFSFNKIVVGPNTGSIGELLKLSNNPIYEPGNIKDAAYKIEEGLALSEGIVDTHSLHKYMNLDDTVNKHLQVYEDVLRS